MPADKTAVKLDLYLVGETVVTKAVEMDGMWVALKVVAMVVSTADMTVVN